ncbi:hypothetical protein ACFV3E_41905 [Streptomyces sp. NPDC059718]
MSPFKPSPADQRLIDDAARYGLTVTAKQLAVWRRAGLLPPNVTMSLGRGRGSASRPLEEAFVLTRWLARNAKRGARPAHLGLLAFSDGLPVPEDTVRGAFRRELNGFTLFAETVTPPGEAVIGPEDAEARAGRIADRQVDSGRLMRLVPTAIRRVDERIAKAVRTRGLEWPPRELVELDRNPDPSLLSAGEATSFAVNAVLLGGPAVTLQGIGDVVRAVQAPGPNPFASLAEFTFDDVPDTAPAVFGSDGGFALLPEGDVRDLMAQIVDASSLEDLRLSWRGAADLREWAVDLYDRVQSELAHDDVGEAVAEWVRARGMLAGMFLTVGLGDRRWGTSAQAGTTLSLLFMRTMLQAVDAAVPGCQWELLTEEGMLPPALRSFLNPQAA